MPAVAEQDINTMGTPTLNNTTIELIGSNAAEDDLMFRLRGGTFWIGVIYRWDGGRGHTVITRAARTKAELTKLRRQWISQTAKEEADAYLDARDDISTVADIADPKNWTMDFIKVVAVATEQAALAALVDYATDSGYHGIEEFPVGWHLAVLSGTERVDLWNGSRPEEMVQSYVWNLIDELHA